MASMGQGVRKTGDGFAARGLMVRLCGEFAGRTRPPAPMQDGRRKELLRLFLGFGREIADEGKRVLTASIEIARGSKAQYEILADSQTTMEEIRRIAVKNSSTSVESRHRIEDARKLLESLSVLSLERSTAIKGLTDSVQVSQAAFREVGCEAEEVERSLAIIAGLGEETDILAMNAAIEAARAGAQGAGFSTVAREMRLLADKTRIVTQQIRQVTERMRLSTSATAAAMAAASDLGSRNSAMAAPAADSLRVCLERMKDAELMAHAVAENAQRQMSAAETLEDRWNAAAKRARESTFAADAAAERSMRTLSLAATFAGNLRKSATDTEETTEEIRVLEDEVDRCRQLAGMDQLERARPSLEGALAALESECRRLGVASRRAGRREEGRSWELCFGGRSVNLSQIQVDTVTRGTDLTATLLVLADADDMRESQFLRVATTLKSVNGDRATGTSLNPRGVVAPRLLAGEAVFGFVFVLGVPYLAAYAPVLDAVGATVGAYYVGKPMV